MNVCQKVCVQLNNPGGTGPYVWSSSNSSVSVLASGSGLSCIIGANFSGGANVLVRDSNNSVIAVFIITVVTIQNYVTPLTSNTAFIASALLSENTLTPAGATNLSGNFSGFASGFPANNVGYFLYSNPGNPSAYVTYLFWNRPSDNTITGRYTDNSGPPTIVQFAFIGIAMTSTSPSANSLNYQVPIVHYVTGTQEQRPLTTVSLPFSLPCFGLLDYMCFVQNSANVVTNTNVKVSGVINANQIQFSWSTSITTYEVSYAIIYRGLRNPSSNFIVYSEVVPVLLTGFTGNQTNNITLDTAVPTTTLWLAQIQSSSLNDSSVFNFRINGASQTSTTVLQISINSLANLGSVGLNVAIIGFFNLGSAITMTIT